MRPERRLLARATSAPYAAISGGSTGGGSNVGVYTQQVVDPGFADATKWTLTGAGVGTSAVVGGVLQITSTTATYFVLPTTLTAPLSPGTYTVTYTVGAYASGTIGTIGGTSAALSGGTAGPARTADATYVENVLLPLGGYIGLAGQGAAVVNSLQVDNMTILRAA